MLNDYQVHDSLEELGIMRMTTSNSYTRVLNPPEEESMYLQNL